MGRQLFLHHYLPSHLASSLVTGALLEFVFTMDTGDFEDTSDGKGVKKKQTGIRRITARDRIKGQNMLPMWAAAGVVLTLVIGGWYFFLPLTYGKPGLDVAGVKARKWLSYDLHFAKASASFVGPSASHLLLTSSLVSECWVIGGVGSDARISQTGASLRAVQRTWINRAAQKKALTSCISRHEILRRSICTLH